MWDGSFGNSAEDLRRNQELPTRDQTHLPNPGRCIHGVTQHDYLAFQIAHLSDDESASMKRTPQEQLRRECAKIVQMLAAKRIGNGGQAGDASGIPSAAFKRPSDNDFVADVPIDRASGGRFLPAQRHPDICRY
jgi:hypothetical protein